MKNISVLVVDLMDTIGSRLRFARKSKGFTQSSLADAIGVSRGVIYNIEKNITEAQGIIINTVCRTLEISKDWLLTGTGKMERRRSDVLPELLEAVEGLSENGQLFILDTVNALNKRRKSDIGI